MTPLFEERDKDRDEETADEQLVALDQDVDHVVEIEGEDQGRARNGERQHLDAPQIFLKDGKILRDVGADRVDEGGRCGNDRGQDGATHKG